MTARPLLALTCGGLLLAGAALAGEEAAPPPTPNGAEVTEPVEDQLRLGRQVFHRKCMKCHRSGRSGAPVFDRASDWRGRLEQSTETLVRHALEGHAGARGTMPPKGGFEDLTDAEVTAAVRYVIASSQRLVALEDRAGRRCEAEDCPPVLMQFLWLLLEGSEPQ